MGGAGKKRARAGAERGNKSAFGFGGSRVCALFLSPRSPAFFILLSARACVSRAPLLPPPRCVPCLATSKPRLPGRVRARVQRARAPPLGLGIGAREQGRRGRMAAAILAGARPNTRASPPWGRPPRATHARTHAPCMGTPPCSHPVRVRHGTGDTPRPSLTHFPRSRLPPPPQSSLSRVTSLGAPRNARTRPHPHPRLFFALFTNRPSSHGSGACVGAARSGARACASPLHIGPSNLFGWRRAGGGLPPPVCVCECARLPRHAGT